MALPVTLFLMVLRQWNQREGTAIPHSPSPSTSGYVGTYNINVHVVEALTGSLGPRLSPQKRGRREPGNIRKKSCRLPARHHPCD